MGAATDVLPSVGAGFVTPLDSRMFAWSVALFVAGFGIKAGMVPCIFGCPYSLGVTYPSSAYPDCLLRWELMADTGG